MSRIGFRKVIVSRIIFCSKGGVRVENNIDADRMYLFLELVASARSSSWVIYEPIVDFLCCSDLTFY